MKHDMDQDGPATGTGDATARSAQLDREKSDLSSGAPADGHAPSGLDTAAIFSALMRNRDYAIITTDAHGIITAYGAGAEKMLGYAPEEVIGRATPDLFHDPAEVIMRAERLSKKLGRPIPPIAPILLTSVPDDSPAEREWVLIRKDGTRLPTLLSVAEIRTPAGDIAGYVGIVHDISNLRKIEDALRRSEQGLRTVMDATPVVLFAMDRNGVFTLSEGKGLARLGLRPGEVVGKSLFELYAAYPPLLEKFRRVLRGEHMTFVAEMDGVVFQTECAPVLDENGEVTGLIGGATDITERWEAERRIQEYTIVLEFQKRELEKANAELAALATMDDLTGLKNQRLFRERIAEEVSRAHRYGTPLTLILLDVDRFKKYNDTFGHLAGDDVLRTLGSLIKQNARETDIAARYGGEEFALLLPQTDLPSAVVIAERLRAAVEAHAWTERPVTISVGVAAWTRRMRDVRHLIDSTDIALYASKAKGRNSVTSAGPEADLASDSDPSVCA